MKKFLIATLLFSFGTAAYAQQVTNEEFKKYIIVMDSIETLKTELTVSMIKLSKGNSKISEKRYQELVPVAADQAKLAELKATPDEIAYVKKAAAIRQEETVKFQNAYQSLIYEYLGNETFTKVRNALKNDVKLKKQYDSLMAKPIQP